MHDRSVSTNYRSVQNTVYGHTDADGYTLVTRKYNTSGNGQKTGGLNRMGRNSEGKRSDNGYGESNGKKPEYHKNVTMSKSSLY
jgi:hypothetical protein